MSPVMDGMALHEACSAAREPTSAVAMKSRASERRGGLSAVSSSAPRRPSVPFLTAAGSGVYARLAAKEDERRRDGRSLLLQVARLGRAGARVSAGPGVRAGRLSLGSRGARGAAEPAL